MHNHQITFAAAPQAHSDVAIAINPADTAEQVVAHKRQLDVSSARCAVVPLYSTSGGRAWTEASGLALPAHVTSTLDPSLAWLAGGHVALAVSGLSAGGPRGIYVYRSTNGGRTWSSPVLAPIGQSFPALAYDALANVLYLVALDEDAVRFARSYDGGSTWIVTETNGAPAALNVSSYVPSAPSVCVCARLSPPTQVILVSWNADDILYVWSTDGGETFTVPHAIFGAELSDDTTPPPGYRSLGQFPNDLGFLPAPSCAAAAGRFVIAWTQFSGSGGAIAYAEAAAFPEPPSSPLAFSEVARVPAGPTEQFRWNPRVAAAKGNIACAFYQTPLSPAGPVDVAVYVLGNSTAAVSVRTDQPWSPQTGAFSANGEVDTEFMIEPMGLAGDRTGSWHAVWPDTRTGARELWMDTFTWAVSTGM